MFGDHGLCGLPEEGAHGKSPKCLGGNLGDFWGILQRSQFMKLSDKISSIVIYIQYLFIFVKFKITT